MVKGLENIDLTWIKDLIYNKQIDINILHNTYTGNLLKSDDTDVIYHTFLKLFWMDLKIYGEHLGLEKIKSGETCFMASGDTCNECGEMVSFIFDGKTLKEQLYDNENRDFIETTECKKVGTYSVDITFPSGRLICADRLPYSIEMLGELDGMHTINSKLGIYERTNNFAKCNILHMAVGNTSPSVFYDKKTDTLAIGSPKLDKRDENIPLIKGSKEITSIITDLWWVSIVDAEFYKNLLIEKFGQEDGLSKFNEIELTKETITPGVYRCTYLKERLDDDFITPITFVKMELIKGK